MDLVDNAFQVLGDESIEYNWKYRQRICVKCPIETQKKLECHKVDNYRIVSGVEIQETHCSKLEKARVQKFRGRMNNLLNMASFNFYGKGKYTQEKEGIDV